MRHIKEVLESCLIVLLLSSCAFAGGGGLGGGALESTQMMNNAELATQVGQLAEQISNQIRMIEDLIYNTLTIPDQLFGDVRQIYSGVKNVLNNTKGIAYTLSNFDEELKRRWKSYSDMSDFSEVKDFTEEYRNIVDSQMETVRTTLEAVNVSWEQMEQDDARALEEIQKKASTAKGRNELIQATNQLLGYMNEEALRLRQLQMLQAQQTGAAFEAERAREDLSKKRLEGFFESPAEEPVNIPSGSLIDRLGGDL